AHRRIKVDIRSHRQNALPMEPRAAHAAWDGASERVTLTCATQTPHIMRTIIADLIGMPEADLRVIAPDVGGGFGQKMSLAAEFGVVTWAAGKLKTSVAWVEDRRENLSPASTAATSRSRSRARSTPTPRSSALPRISSPMSAPIHAIRPPAASSR